jgi:hypothetical protein
MTLMDEPTTTNNGERRFMLRLAERASRRARTLNRLLRQLCPHTPEDQLRAIAAGHPVRMIATDTQVAILEEVLTTNGFNAMIDDGNAQLLLFHPNPLPSNSWNQITGWRAFPMSCAWRYRCQVRRSAVAQRRASPVGMLRFDSPTERTVFQHGTPNEWGGYWVADSLPFTRGLTGG